VKNRPLILITGSTQKSGAEFCDRSLSLSDCYPKAIAAAGGIPWILPLDLSAGEIAESVRRADGLMLTGGDDVQPELYLDEVPGSLRRTVGPPDGIRDWNEILLVNQALRQHKPLLAICRGHQLLQVALGGKLVLDIQSEIAGALNHRQMDRKDQLVHPIEIVPDSLLARLTARRVLRVNSSHHQGVSEAVSPLRATASSSDGIAEAMELDDRERDLSPFLLSVQFHPERLFARYKEFFSIFSGFINSCRDPRRLSGKAK
jgi:putative glutamine amidotransferase